MPHRKITPVFTERCSWRGWYFPEDLVDWRWQIAERYRAEITNPGVRRSGVRSGQELHLWHLSVVRVQDR